jgi:hypothetical protein
MGLLMMKISSYCGEQAGPRQDNRSLFTVSLFAVSLFTASPSDVWGAIDHSSEA